jgi:Ca-activated chloride channel homolog
VKPLHFSFLIVVLGALLGWAPQQTVEAPTILSVRTDLVTLTVTVVDSRGVFVPGLSREQFTIYDEGQPRPIEFFSSDDVPATIGLVIDSSGSMRSQRATVTAAASAFAGMSHPLDEFFTMNFNEAVWPGLPARVRFTEDRNQLYDALAAAPAQGMTALYDAIDRALDHLSMGARERKALIVVSDGGDNASRRTFEDALAHARRTSAVIYGVTLFDRDDHDAKPRLVKRLAQETGGRAFAPRSDREVHDAFEHIAREIRSAYTIGFAPPDTGVAGPRLLRVAVDAGDRRVLTARTRAGYYAGPAGQTTW